jgi:hypothetical protein
LPTFRVPFKSVVNVVRIPFIDYRLGDRAKRFEIKFATFSAFWFVTSRTFVDVNKMYEYYLR